MSERSTTTAEPNVVTPHEPSTMLEPARVLGPVPDWGTTSLLDVAGDLLSTDRPFPCTFAVSALRQGSLCFTFVEDLHEVRTWPTLRHALRRYLEIYQSLGRNTSMVALFRPDARPFPIAEYQERFWAVLQDLHDHDSQPWPTDLPGDPEHPRWEFAFEGMPMFVVCNTPSHELRVSRRANGFMITFQPRWVFEKIGPESRQGRAARRIIRARLRRYDEVAPAPELGDYGAQDNREYRQYFLPDNNDTDRPSCPLRLHTDG